MVKITLAIDEDVLRRARIKAIAQHTSVNAVVRDFLNVYASTEDQQEAFKEFLRLAKQSKASSGPEGWSWTREELYEDRRGRFDTR